VRLLDTDICIAFLNGKDRKLERRMLEAAEDLILCSVVKAELWFAAEASARVSENHERLGNFFDTLDCLPFDDAAARHYGRVRAALRRDGRPIGPNDLLIASIALANDTTLITRNRREYERVPGLAIETW
jgi:tRNA(fMet)-specific endonuclease VapC